MDEIRNKPWWMFNTGNRSTQHNDIQHNIKEIGTQYKIKAMPSVEI
jgi:hypothetical protein